MENIENRYMLDTNVINKLFDNYDDFCSVKRSSQRGTEYFLTETQYEEVRKSIIPNSLASSEVESIEVDRAQRAISLMEVIARLNTKHASRYATFYEDGWPLDGSCDILPDEEVATFPMFLDIYNDNKEHYNDAMIALVAVANGCTLVTNDKRLRNKVNSHFSGRSVSFDEFISLISNG